MVNLKAVCEVLDEFYGSPNLENKQDPLDELMFIILSQKTGERSFTNTYDLLRKKYKTWNDVMLASDKQVEKIIRPGGLSKTKARQIRRVLNEIFERNRALSLDNLKSCSDQEAERFLTSLYGVGIKTAKCVLLYSLNRQVLPVDVHTYRLALELELVESSYMRNEKGKLHDKLEKIIPPKLRYKFHVNAVVHGREEHKSRTKQTQKCRLIEELISRGLFRPSKPSTDTRVSP